VTLANALFFSFVAVWLVSRGYPTAFARAQVSGSRSVRKSGRAIGFIADVLFAYLPGQQRLLAVKDLKSFFRDPLQWSQMAILFALLGLYAARVPQLWIKDFSGSQLQSLISFLNLTAVSLILATFTSRFVFPLVSLEGQQLWLLGLLPLRRSRMILAKFLYASTITLIAAIAVMGISVYRLELPGALALAHLIAAAAICIGLCGVSIGVGARMPVFHERNPARIAGGFGGTVSLLVSVALVIGSLVCMGMMSLRTIQTGFGDTFTREMAVWLAIVVGINFLTAMIALRIGIKHFERVEW
jgi:ABC-2 type transport system permease protein